MPIYIRMDGPDSEQELASLYAWFGDDSTIRQHTAISMVMIEPRPSDMGVAFDTIQLIVDSGFQAANLAFAYAAWRATRPARPRVTIKIDDVSHFVLDDHDPHIVDVIVKALE
jgi:Effector Associated Constant Component 1